MAYVRSTVNAQMTIVERVRSGPGVGALISPGTRPQRGKYWQMSADLSLIT